MTTGTDSALPALEIRRDYPGIYIHIPFCRRICPYCDFAVRRDHPQRRAAFVDRLVREIEAVAWSGPEDFDTVYFGGGTPSILSPAELRRIVVALRRRFTCSDRLRIFLEANPEDVSRQLAQQWKQIDIGFVSLGVQALNEQRLDFLGREHSLAQARQAIEVVLDAGFDTVSVDLIYGHNGHEVSDWVTELGQVTALGVGHLSCYSLTVSRGTVFGKLAHKGHRFLPSDAKQAEFFTSTHRTLNELGMKGYEVSNFALSREHRSAHNLKYWRGIPYLGLGPSAHSFDGGRRWWNLRHEGAWARSIDCNETPVEESEELHRKQRLEEVLMLGLRTVEGVDLNQIRRQFSVDLQQESKRHIEEIVGQGLATLDGSRLSLTVEGWAVADAVTVGF